MRRRCAAKALLAVRKAREIRRVIERIIGIEGSACRSNQRVRLLSNRHHGASGIAQVSKSGNLWRDSGIEIAVCPSCG